MPSEVKAQDTTSLASIKTVNEAATQSRTLLAEMEQAAEDAGTTLDGIYQDAKDAQSSADIARTSADIAFKQLGYVEDIVGVLSMIAEHGQFAAAQEDEVLENRWYFEKTSDGKYEVVNNLTSVFHLTTDTSIEAGKTYYTRSGTGTEEDPYVYTAVETPVQAELSTYYEKYYVLVGIDEAIQNYVSSHLVLLEDGLWLQANDNDAKIQISTEQGNEGVILYGSNNKPLAHYGSTTVIGDKDGFHIEIDGQEIGFYNAQTQVAYMTGSSLYVENNLSFGHFIFLERPNGHFTLKLID